jgi:uncharacterized protein YggU (UPF0235/DUF167 family)
MGRVAQTAGVSRFDVFVVPRSNNPGPHGWHGGLPRLRVKSPPADGAANDECERRLTELLGTRVTLVRGGQSRKKTFEVDLLRGELDARLHIVFPAVGS